MKKALCTIGLIASILVTIYLGLNLSIWAFVSVCCMIGFATLEAHYDGVTEYTGFSRDAQ